MLGYLSSGQIGAKLLESALANLEQRQGERKFNEGLQAAQERVDAIATSSTNVLTKEGRKEAISLHVELRSLMATKGLPSSLASQVSQVMQSYNKNVMASFAVAAGALLGDSIEAQRVLTLTALIF